MCLLTAALAAPAAAADPPAPTDGQLAAAVQRGLDFLWKGQSQGRWPTKYARHFAGGVEAIAVWAALESGADADAGNVRAVLAHLTGFEPEAVYARAVRAVAYARLPQDAYAPRLRADVAWLVENQSPGGGWGYGPKHPTTGSRPAWVDNSNSQLALLALDAAADAGADVPRAAWDRARKHWLGGQNPDGGWGYEPAHASRTPLRARSYGSLTAAGVASLQILARHPPPPPRSAPGELFVEGSDPKTVRETLHKATDRGLRWLDQHYTPTEVPGWLWGGRADAYVLYYLHCLVRAAEGAGRRRIGGKVYLPQVARAVLQRQKPNGGWAVAQEAGGDDMAQTALALLILARCRAAVLVSALPMGSSSPADTRGAARLARWLERALGRAAAWQRLDPNPDPSVLGRSPVLVLNAAGGQTPSAAALRKVAAFARRGGTVLVQTPPGDRQWVARMTRIVPGWSAAPLPADHPVFRAKFRIPPRIVTGVGDAAHTRILLCQDDLAGAWRRGPAGQDHNAFRFYANLLLYATAERPPAGRLEAPPPPTATARIVRSVAVARVRHRGGWNVCPQAARRLGQVLARALSIGITEAEPVDLDGRVDPRIPLLWMTGVGKASLTATQRENLRLYLLAGGTVFLDAAAGRGEFFPAAKAMLERMFPGRLQRLPKTHPLLTGQFAGGMGADVSGAAYTRAANTPPGPPPLHAVILNGRAAAILSPLGVTAPVVGSPVWRCAGLCTPDARRLAANVVLYAASR